MSLAKYGKGILKVVWVDIKEPQKIYSQMFNNQESAKKFAEQKKYYLVFSLENRKGMKEFTWNILPFGEYKIYQLFVSNYLRFKEIIFKLPI
jgi:hypothetical protein